MALGLVLLLLLLRLLLVFVSEEILDEVRVVVAEVSQEEEDWRRLVLWHVALESRI